jgi:hypothetical protein
MQEKEEGNKKIRKKKSRKNEQKKKLGKEEFLHGAYLIKHRNNFNFCSL